MLSVSRGPEAGLATFLVAVAECLTKAVKEAKAYLGSQFEGGEAMVM